NFDLKPVPAAQTSANQKKGKHMVWVPASTGSHIGGRWVEVPDGATEPGALNVQKANAEAVQRQAQRMGGASSGRLVWTDRSGCIVCICANCKIGAALVHALSGFYSPTYLRFSRSLRSALSADFLN